MTLRSGAVFGTVATVACLLATSTRSAADKPATNQLTFGNDSGVQRSITTAESYDLTNPFFQDLGTNGRTCFSCHRPAQGWTITPAELQVRFKNTDGLDPIFRTNDGSNCGNADLSTTGARRQAFSLLLSKGLIRVGLDVPADAEFDIVDVDDPYGCNANFTGAAMYRRPLPASNLGFLSTVMWDGRETVPGRSMRANLLSQAEHATTGHAQGAAPSIADRNAIVDFETALYTAQTQDNVTGSLTAKEATGGPGALSTQSFCIGANDPLGMLPDMPGACPAPTGFSPTVFTLFTSWQNDGSAQRRAVARGQELFNRRTFTIDRVRGLNGGPGDPVAGPIAGGTCTLCHDAPNAGNHSVSMALDLGLTDAAQRTPDLPLYTLQNRTTGETMQTTDPGRAMVTGKWADVGKFKGPVLRGLAARAPYFHNGAAATLDEAVDFYDARFNIGLSAQEKSDLVAFLRAL